jgi:glucose/arabinose dehydrogenase
MRSRALVCGVAFGLASQVAQAFQFPAGEPSDTFDAATYAEGFKGPTDFRLLPDGRGVVVERLGDVVVVLPDQTQVRSHIELFVNHGEQGLLGVVPHEHFADNHYLYFYASVSEDVDNHHQVIRYTLGGDNLITDPKIIVEHGLRGPANHNGGGLEFYRGALYISVGDTGRTSTPPINRFGTCLNIANGKILRVDPETGDPFPGNPLVGLEMVTGCDSQIGELGLRPPDERIFAWGFRNPFRFWIDPQSGLMWIGDVGEKAKEEISVGGGGKHYGWPFFEGSVEYSQEWKPADACNGIVPPSDCHPPALEYNHGDSGSAVIGGLILDGCGWPDMWRQRYLFGDPNRGIVYTAQVNETRDGMVPGTILAFGSISGLSAIRFGQDNGFYLVEYGAGRITRITAKGAPTSCVRGVDGDHCSTAADCGSNRCVDGVCCNADCDGTCEACNEELSGALDGTCAPIVAGQDPEGECEPDAGYPESCGADGNCDGASACREHAEAGTSCSASCDEGSELISACDGDGECVSNEPTACQPYVCGEEACLTECESEDDCDSGSACIDHACSADGGCTSDDDCADGETCDIDSGSCQADEGTGGAGGVDAHEGGASAGGSLTTKQDADCDCAALGRADTSRDAHWAAIVAGFGLLVIARRRRSAARRPGA